MSLYYSVRGFSETCSEKAPAAAVTRCLDEALVMPWVSSNGTVKLKIFQPTSRKLEVRWAGGAFQDKAPVEGCGFMSINIG
jgi:hypothetical protein